MSRIATLCVLLTGLVPLACADDVPGEVNVSASSSGTGPSASTTSPITQTATSSQETGVVDGTSATAGESTGSPGESCCDPHAGPGCEHPSVASCVCELEAECCAFEWSQACVNLAETNCGGCDPGGGSTDGGTTGGGNDACCEPLMMPGCAEDPMVEACVCGMDPYCCDTAWDGKCVGIAEGACGVTCDGGGTGGMGDCCMASGMPGCNDPAIEGCVCALDPYCCNNEWDGICVAEAQYECMDMCGLPPPGGDCCMAHDGPECDDVMLTECVCMVDNACCLFPWSNDCVGIAVNQCGGMCEGVFVPDPCCMPSMMPGCVTMDIESCVCAFDDYCCNNEWDGQCVEEAQVDCAMECYPPGTEDCCMPHMSTGCTVPEVQACVCGMDPFCCNNEWDGQCVDEANNDCGGCMGGGGTGGGSTGGGGMGDCCMANGSPGCDDPAIEACVCASLPSCCGVDWSLPCVDEANLACMAMCAP